MNQKHQKRLRLIQVHQQVVEQAITERIQQAKSFSILGPPDLLHLTRAKTKTFGRKQIKTSFCFVSGLDIRTPAHLSLFVTQLITFEKQSISSYGKIQKAILCIYDALNRVDIHLEVKIPGSPKLTIYSKKGQVIELKSNQQTVYYQTAFYSSIIRAMSHRYFPFIKAYQQVLDPVVFQQLLPRMLPILNQKKFKLQSKYLTRSNYAIDIIFYEILIRNLTKTANVGLKALQQLDSNIGNLMVCCLHQQQFQHQKVLGLTATCLQSDIQYEYLYIQAVSLMKLRKFDQSLTISKFLILSCKYNTIFAWQLLCKCYFYKSQFKDMIIALNTAVSVLQPKDQGVDQWVTVKQEIPSLMFKNSKGFNVSKPTGIIQSSLQPNYCLSFDNQFINRFSRIKILKTALEKQQKEQKIFKMLEKLQSLLKNNNNQLKYIGPLFKMLIMMEKLRGWQHLINVRNRIFWLESDFTTINEVLLKNETSFMNQENNEFDPNCEYMEKSMQDIDEDKNIKNVKRTLFKQQTVEEPYQEPRETLEGKAQEKETKAENQVSQQNKQIKLVISESNLQVKNTKSMIEPPEATTKRFQQTQFIPKHLNQMYSQKILCSEKLEIMINTLFSHLSLLLELDSWEQNLRAPSSYPVDRNQLHAIILLKKSFLQTKLLRYRKAQSTLKKALKFSQYDISKLSIQYNLCVLYLDGRKFKACELYMIEVLTTLYNLGVKQYDSFPLWLLKIIRDVIDATGGVKQFQDAMKNWPPKLNKIVWQDSLKSLYSK